MGINLKLCTFNVNSIRTRKDLVMNWLKKRKNDLDVLCFQELKGIDSSFPIKVFENCGFNCEVYGQKRFNGVAICSKLQVRDLKKGFGDNYWDEQKRIIAGKGSTSDLDLLITVANQIEGNTICALGEAAAWPVKFMVERFRDYFEARVKKEINLPVANKVHSMRETSYPLADIEK